MTEHLDKTKEWLERLISFDTTSRLSNLELINDIEKYLNTLGIQTRLTHNNEKSKQINIDLTSDVGKMWKKVMDSVGDKYLTDMVGRLSKSDCFEVWTNHAYAGDYNPYHTHGCNTVAGLSGFMWLSNPQSIEDRWSEWTANLEPGSPKIPNLAFPVSTSLLPNKLHSLLIFAIL